jgi:ankyrin repeat protein
MSTAKQVSALMSALYERDQERITELLAEGPVLDLFECAALGRTAELPREAELSKLAPDGFSALHLACFFAHAETARELTSRGADVDAVADNASHVQPLHSAAAARSAEVVTLLLEHGAPPDAAQHGGWTALHAAAMHGDVPMARTLLAHGADPDLAADDGHSARSLAADKPEWAALLEG